MNTKTSHKTKVSEKPGLYKAMKGMKEGPKKDTALPKRGQRTATHKMNKMKY